MSHLWTVLAILYLICTNQETESVIAVRKYVYQKDISEHCRRRAVPSVFLSKQVLEANSHVLDFSRLELPYSCFISVRTESGNNIILVAQLLSDKSLTSACSASADQLLVYEMGETFGGYWGALPDVVLQPKNTEPKYYTKRARPKPVTIIDLSDGSDSEQEIRTETPYPQTVHKTTEDDGFIRIEVPLVNLSGKLVPGEVPPKKILDIDDTFDVLYDVTPKAGEKYETTIVPLVQFAIQEASAKVNGERRYQLDYEIGNFTPDPRSYYYFEYTHNIKDRADADVEFRIHGLFKKPMETIN